MKRNKKTSSTHQLFHFFNCSIFLFISLCQKKAGGVWGSFLILEGPGRFGASLASKWPFLLFSLCFRSILKDFVSKPLPQPLPQPCLTASILASLASALCFRSILKDFVSNPCLSLASTLASLPQPCLTCLSPMF